MKQHSNKSSSYYKALQDAFDALGAMPHEEFQALLKQQESSELTKLILGYAESNQLEVLAMQESIVNESFTLSSAKQTRVNELYSNNNVGTFAESPLSCTVGIDLTKEFHWKLVA